MEESTSEPPRSLNPLSQRQNIEHIDSNSKVISTPLLKPVKDRDFLTHLESCLTKCDDVDKLLKISNYAAKIILSSSPKPPLGPLSTPTLNPSNPTLASLQGLPPRHIHQRPQHPPPHLPPLAPHIQR
ncbi:hypothetical protein MRB53_011208 [Persea americana]|uniref:Uncharacterized protein n=1 Tax=Persea americana TaxID=3435 RepID=A0ACC2LTW9_PERAE|nr:hypothetical protein MRB53_011208 [Persea americana]